MLGKISCPSLQHFALTVRDDNPHTTLTFLERDRLRDGLLSFECEYWDRDAVLLLPLLRLMPSLVSLRVWSNIDNEFLTALAATNTVDGRIVLCPRLQSIDLHSSQRTPSGDREIVHFIQSRWQAPERTVQAIKLWEFAWLRYVPQSRDSSLPESWEVVAQCIKEGLVFESGRRVPL